MAQDNLKLAQKLFNYTNTHNIPGMMAGNQSKIESMTFNPRYPGFDEQNYRKLESKIDELGLVGNEREKAMDQLYVQVLPQVQNQIINSDRRKYINDAAYEVSQIQNKSDKTQAKSKLTVTELAQQLKEKFNIDPTANDEEVFNSWIESIPNGGQLLADYMNDGDPQLLYQGGLESVPEDVRQKLKDNFWNNLWDNIKTKANVPVDNIKKWGQRTLNNLGAEIYKNILKKTVGDALPEKMGINLDNYVNTFQENAITPRVQENVTDYQNKINQAYAAKEQKNLDQDIKNYYDQKGYTEMLKEGDFRGFLFKSMGDAAQNWEMPVVVAASVFQPEVGMALMTTDAYARENQEAFENMMNNGASYEEAEQGAVVVGLVNAAVEVTLEKLIGGVEASASGAIRKTLMKNVQEEAAKKGLGRILLEGVGTQLRASGEEGLEEIVQQIVQNAAVKTVNENQKLFEGVGAAFEGGFYNPMNLLAGGGNLTQNVNQNKDVVRQQIMDGAYNASQAARTVTDKVGITKNGTNVDVETTETTRNGNGIMDTITDWGAEKITKTSTPQDKLYKAQEPRMNVLSNKKNLENRRANSDRANELIVQNGYVPTSTSERLDAHQATLNKLWGQVMDQVNQGEGVTVDQTPMIDALSEYINSKKKLGVAGIESDIRALESELGSLQKMQEEGTTDLPTLEAKKQVYNDLIDWKGQEASEVYKGGIKLLTQEIGKIEDAMISKIPGEFSSLKKDVGALLDTYEDVFKADMKNQRKKGLGLTETYSRIEGIGDTLGGIFQLFKGDVSGVAKGLGKLALGKSLAKASDADFLIEQGFKELANQQGLNQSQASSKNAKYQVAEEVSPMEEWSIFGLEDENTLHFVEDIQKSLPKKSATNSLPAGYIAAMIDNMKGSMRAKYGRDAVDRLIDLINDASKKETGNGKEYGIGLSSKEFEIWRSKLRERADAGLNQNQASSKTARYQVADDSVPTQDNTGKKLSKGQQEYFKGSKVVDEDGNLLRVYHGTRSDYTVYQQGKGEGANSLSSVGFRFTPTKEGALGWAEQNHRGDGKARAEEVYLDIKNPKIYEPSDIYLLEGEAKKEAINNQWNIYKKKEGEANNKDYTYRGGMFNDEFNHPYYERAIFENLQRSYETDKNYDGKLGKYDPEAYRALAEEFNRNYNANIDYDKVLEDFTEYVKLKEEAQREYEKYLDMEYSDPYEDFQYDIYKLDSNMDNRWTKKDLNMALNDYSSPRKFTEKLKSEGYDGIIIKQTDYDGNVFGGRNDQYVVFDSNQIKKINNLNPTKNEDIRYQRYGTANANEQSMTANEGLNIRNFKNGKTVQELAKQYGIDTKIVDSISTPEGQRAYGMYGDRLITLSKDLAESTVPHELLHAVFDMVDQSKRKSILDGVQKKLGVDDVQAEEWLADSFSEYYRTGTFGTQGLAKTFIEKVKQFFYKVKSYIDGTYKNEKQIRQLFDDIIDGKIEGEYGVYSDPRFQTVWHGSPYSFEKFDSAHMGEGEGAQAHGWGHYVAVEERTGRHYAEMGDRSPKAKFEGKSRGELERELGVEPTRRRDPKKQVAYEILDRMEMGEESFNVAKERIRSWTEADIRSWEDDYKETKSNFDKESLEAAKNRLEIVKNITEDDFEMIGNRRNLYEVEIPDPVKADTPTRSNYLEEDGKITYKQLEKIADGLKDYDQRGERGKERFLEGIIRDLENQKGYWDDKLGKYVIEGDMTGRELYSHLIDFFGGRERGEKTASKFLESLGYDGIHYYGARDGESYVIFNDDALEIKKHEQY